MLHRGLSEAHDARIMYVDMNAFFASIEQQRRPELRGKPVAVVTHIGGAGSVLASSYEAKAFGLKTGMRLRDAWVLCPRLISVETDLHVYRAVHLQFMALMRDIIGDEVQARSVDEVACFLPRNWANSEHANLLAHQVKERIRNELGEYIKCSIGIGPNTLLAKLATDLQKPDGLVEISLENTTRILTPLDLTALPGIASRNAERLKRRNISTPLELYNTPIEVLRQFFGAWGQYWYWRLHGFEVDGTNEGLKTMSHQHALKEWTPDLERLHDPLTRMADRLTHRLRRNELQCKSVWVHASMVGMRGLHAERVFDAPCQSYPHILQTIEELFDGFPNPAPAPVRMLAVGFNNLSPSHNGWQMDLFGASKKEEAVSTALELVRSQHGFQAIQRGNVIVLDEKLAKEQLGFGRVKDIEHRGN